MAICVTCPVLERLALTMRNAMQQWRNYEGPTSDAAAAEPRPG